MKKKIFLLLFLFFCFFVSGTARRNDDYSKGPFYGKNLFSQYVLYYCFPGVDPGPGEKFKFSWHVSTYYTQDFMTNWKQLQRKDQIDSTHFDHTQYVTTDYESFTLETGADFYITRKLQLGMDMRLITYYGGFLDSFIEGFHSIFNFPNAGREYFIRDNIFINIYTNNNIRIFLDKPSAGFGDIDLWVKYNFFHNRFLDLAVMGAFKIPTGRINSVSGSGYPDFGVSLLMNFKPVWFLSLYTQTGLVVPIDVIPAISSDPYPMFQGIFGVEIHPHRIFSFLVQLNLKTPPFTGDIIYMNNLYITGEFFSQPQTNLLFGGILYFKPFRVQIYFEEDAFTNAGVDFTLNIMLSHSFRIYK